MPSQNVNNWQGPAFLAFTFCFLFALTVFSYKKVSYGRTIANYESMEKYIWNFSYKY